MDQSGEINERAHLESTPSAEGTARMVDALGGGTVENLQRLGGGLDSATHRFELNGRALVLKRARPGYDEGVAWEFEHLSWASRSVTVTPEPIACDTGGEWFDTAGLVMAALPGAPDLRPPDLSRWVTELAHALAGLHDTPTDGFTPRHAPSWERWEPWVDEPDDRLIAISDAIRALSRVATDAARYFTHDDYHPGNTIFSGGSLTGVVDWAFATREPRESAVAYCRKDLAIHPGGDAPDQFLQAYEAEIGERLEHIALWDVLQGARALRLGHRWPPSFKELGVDVNAAHIHRVSAEFVDAALQRSRDLRS
jgi:aminoglycoside phosphotransferase (APT) family kinase protein